MSRAIDVRGIRIFAKTAACAHSCRYCLVGPKKITNVAFSRFADVVERFIDWRIRQARPSFSILAGYADSYEFDAEILKGLFDLLRKLGWGEEGKGIKLGGLKLRSDGEMQNWLKERQEVADLKIVHASLAGLGETHDRWNGRKGDFDFLIQTMKTASELCLRVHQRIFIVKSTLPMLDALMSALDDIPGDALRYLSTFVYRGFARRLEDERITEDDRNALPSCVKTIAEREGDRWFSEREWIEYFCDEISADTPEKVLLDLEITDSNIERIEHMSCEEIIEEATKISRETYSHFPSRSELLVNYSELTNRRIYASMEDLERKWLDQYMTTHNVTSYASLR